MTFMAVTVSRAAPFGGGCAWRSLGNGGVAEDDDEPVDSDDEHECGCDEDEPVEAKVTAEPV